MAILFDSELWRWWLRSEEHYSPKIFEMPVLYHMKWIYFKLRCGLRQSEKLQLMVVIWALGNRK